MQVFVIFLVLIILLIAPVKIAANYVGARNTGVLMCVVALIFAAAIQKGVEVLIPQLAQIHPALGVLVSVLLSAFAYMLVLGTTYSKGIVIAILQILLTLLILFVIGLLGLGISMDI